MEGGELRMFKNSKKYKVNEGIGGGSEGAENVRGRGRGGNSGRGFLPRVGTPCLHDFIGLFYYFLKVGGSGGSGGNGFAERL